MRSPLAWLEALHAEMPSTARLERGDEPSLFTQRPDGADVGISVAGAPAAHLLLGWSEPPMPLPTLTERNRSLRVSRGGEREGKTFFLGKVLLDGLEPAHVAFLLRHDAGIAIANATPPPALDGAALRAALTPLAERFGPIKSLRDEADGFSLRTTTELHPRLRVDVRIRLDDGHAAASTDLPASADEATRWAGWINGALRLRSPRLMSEENLTSAAPGDGVLRLELKLERASVVARNGLVAALRELVQAVAEVEAWRSTHATE